MTANQIYKNLEALRTKRDELLKQAPSFYRTQSLTKVCKQIRQTEEAWAKSTIPTFHSDKLGTVTVPED